MAESSQMDENRFTLLCPKLSQVDSTILHTDTPYGAVIWNPETLSYKTIEASGFIWWSNGVCWHTDLNLIWNLSQFASNPSSDHFELYLWISICVNKLTKIWESAVAVDRLCGIVANYNNSWLGSSSFFYQLEIASFFIAKPCFLEAAWSFFILFH